MQRHTVIRARRRVLVGGALVTALMAVGGEASAAGRWMHCGAYPANDGADGYSFPAVGRVRVRGGGCATGYAVARAIRRHWSHGHAFPVYLRPLGRRFTCQYVERQGNPNPYMDTTCRSGTGRRTTVRMDLGS